MIQINYSGTVSELTDAAVKANELLQSLQFYADIKAHPTFKFADCSPAVIADLIFNATIGMTVELYFDDNPRVFGYDDTVHPEIIHINSNRNEFNVPALANTMIHETVHAVNNLNQQYYFGHHGNSSWGKENTAPYWIGNHAEQLIRGSATITPMIHGGSPESLE
jgi:hypothetical protein